MIKQNLNNFSNKGISTPLGITIIILITILAGGILAWQSGLVWKTPAPTPTPTPTRTLEECEKIESIELRGNCYVELAISENDPSICWKIETASLSFSCWEYFGMKDWQTYRNEEYGFEIKYPADWYYSNNETCFNPQDIFPDYCTVFVEAERNNLSNFIEDELEQYSRFTIERYLDQFNGIKGEVFKIEDQSNNLSLYRKLFIFENKDKGYIYVLDGEGDSEKIFNQILSTFKFINPVAEYLEGVELQREGEIQKENIITALNDALKLSAEQLKEKRYKDYVGKENQWDLPTLIYRHFVPDKQGKFLGNNFYYDVKSVEVQNQIKQILEFYFE